MKGNNKRIAKNTLMLYFRQILILIVSLYTVQIVLDVLGVVDYGIYSVVAGIVSLLSFLSGGMSSATQRFFSFALGKNDLLQLKNIFFVNIVIYSVVGLFALILFETIGLWYVTTHLNIPDDRAEAVGWIYQMSILSFIFSIIVSPFMAIIIAHEDMQIYAYVSIIEVILKVCTIFLLQNINIDKLILYSLLLLIISVVVTTIYIIICIRRYKECQFSFKYWSSSLMNEIFAFTGWTFFGYLTTVFRNQAVTILLNQAFSPVVVAARAISTNITSQIGIFSNNFNVGLYPPIIKSYAAGKQGEMFDLIFNGAKISFFLLWIFAFPLILELDLVLDIWLKSPPENTILFTRLALIEVLINSVSLPIVTAARAPGKMKKYELTLGSIQLCIFMFSWLVLELGGAAYTVYVVAIAANIIMFYVRLILVKGLIALSIQQYMYKVIWPVFLVAFLSTTITIVAKIFLPQGIISSIIIILISVVLSSVSMFFIGLDLKMREKVIKVIGDKFHYLKIIK